jgi:hypothetical protein
MIYVTDLAQSLPHTPATFSTFTTGCTGTSGTFDSTFLYVARPCVPRWGYSESHLRQSDARLAAGCLTESGSRLPQSKEPAAPPQIPIMNLKTDLETENTFCHWSTGILPVLENGPPACSSK